MAATSTGNSMKSKKTPQSGKPSRPAQGSAGRIKFDDVKRIVRLMLEADLNELEISDGDMRIALKRGAGQSFMAAGLGAAMAPLHVHGSTVPHPSAATAPPGGASAPVEKAEPVSETLVDIRSPMVGTFYAAPSPDSPAYVKVGDAVTEDTVVCIIEAMKVMNEIKAECAGALAEVCVRNVQPVEYGQVLFRVRPS
jgi:acetyl-CoA carboxylase biotin carboxyl carrier protein